MKAVAILFAGFVAIGVSARTFNGKTRLALFLLVSGIVLYVTITSGW